MKTFATNVDDSFGYTPDTAYFTLSGMFRQRLGDPAWRLALNHLTHYNFSTDWNIPVAPEAYTRSGKLFGDQYSNFNAGKLLLYLEGLAGLEYSIPDNRLVVHDTMPTNWKWMEVRLPIQMPGDQETRWPVIRYERTERKSNSESTDERGSGNETIKSISVTDCPLRITIEPWSEEKRVIRSDMQPATGRQPTASNYPHYSRYVFNDPRSTASVKLRLASSSAGR